MNDRLKYNHVNFKRDHVSHALVKCPKCDLANYAPAVMSGVCVWCGFDINKKEEKK